MLPQAIRGDQVSLCPTQGMQQYVLQYRRLSRPGVAEFVPRANITH